jgi:hypothetical protein
MSIDNDEKVGMHQNPGCWLDGLKRCIKMKEGYFYSPSTQYNDISKKNDAPLD